MLPHLEDTIVAPATATGSGLRAIVRLSGSNSAPIVRSLFTADDSASSWNRRLFRGSLQLPSLNAALPAEVQWYPGPRSYTGEDVVEIHTFGSPPLVEALTHALMNAGARAALPGEFTLRAFLHGKKDLPQAEAVYSVIEAGSPDELQEALNQLAGGVTQPLQGLRDALLNLLADLEAGLDFAEEDITFVSQREVLLLLTKAMGQLTNVQKQLQGRGVSDQPFRVVLCGEPNAGKSSLFNALLEDQAAIISPIPGTTRDYLTRSIMRHGVTIELIDTAGEEEAREAIMSQAQAARQEQLDRADLILWCVPVEVSLDSSVSTDERTWLIRTKCDDPITDERFHTSARTGQGITVLRDALFERARITGRTAIAPSLSRCRHHVDGCLEHLRKVHSMVLFEDPPELTALELRLALDQLGEMVGAIYTDDLLDRIFSRFCIGK